MVSLKDAIRLRVSRRATANLSFLPRRERPLLAGKPLHPSFPVTMEHEHFFKTPFFIHSIHRWPGVTPQIAFSSKRKVPNRSKTNSSMKPNKFHYKYVCFAGRKTRKERKICLKIRLFAFPQRLVTGSTTTAARKVVSSSTLTGPFKI